MSQPDKVQRYDLVWNRPEMTADDDGEWCMYPEVARLLAERDARIAEFRAALEPFAVLAQLFDDGMRGGNMPGEFDSDPIMEWPRVNANYQLTAGNLRAARKALAESQPKGASDE